MTSTQKLLRNSAAALAASSLLVLSSCSTSLFRPFGFGAAPAPGGAAASVAGGAPAGAPAPPPAPTPPPAGANHPKGYKTQNPYHVISPYPPNNLIDISKNPKNGQPFLSGDLVKDPSNGGIFRIP